MTGTGDLLYTLGVDQTRTVQVFIIPDEVFSRTCFVSTKKNMKYGNMISPSHKPPAKN
jgi:hypothetical protein